MIKGELYTTEKGLLIYKFGRYNSTILYPDKQNILLKGKVILCIDNSFHYLTYSPPLLRTFLSSSFYKVLFNKGIYYVPTNHKLTKVE